MYGGGPSKISSTVTKEARALDPNAEAYTKDDAQNDIAAYMNTFKQFSKWLTTNQALIQKNGYTYSFFGRKRRLANVFSSDKATAAHTVRSGINFLIQSPASDVNLLAGIEMQQWINENEYDAKIFALVHDSILAEVREDLVDEYCEKLSSFIKKDRGLSIPDFPIGCDFEVGDDYSFGTYEDYEAYWDARQQVS